MTIDLKNQVYIITGSGRGIGLEIAKAFAENNCTVILSDYNEDSLAHAQKIFDESGYHYRAIACDITKEDHVENLVDKTFNEFGKIDGLINNAGITRDNLLIRMKNDQWDAVIDTNLKGVFLTSRAVAKYFLKQRYGKIINIASVVGLIGNASQANYSSSKAGVIGFTKSIAKELGSRNVTANAIAPGFIETEMTHVLSDKAKDEFLKNIPMKRPGKPKDVANAALFLASSMADYITGQVLTVDGGMVM
ncbi:MAG: 3-oxoacyl-[acyl-carrier-protein] reductase [Candidatus Marinimicrobia bacterium]|nr:3-oxoacyl-[acyl-carrier-protein] reductase [Candidatus Neomarinimicrobiota bacterium]